MIYYPVCIPTLNRYEHLKACVESLQRCTHADKTELIIGLDALPPPPNYEVYREGYEKVKAYLPTITGFAKVTILERDTNYGAERNTESLAEYCLERYDAYIFTEDDNVFSPCFLDYMDKALERYRDDERIFSVCGFCHPWNYGLSKGCIHLEYDNSAWGTGYWRNKYHEAKRVIKDKSFLSHATSRSMSKKIVNTYPRGFRMLLNMIRFDCSWGDVEFGTYNVMTNHYQIKPALSLVRNIGCDGSGIHCGVDTSITRQIISSETTFNYPDNIEMLRTDVIGRGPLFHAMPTDSQAYLKEKQHMLRQARILHLLCVFPWLRRVQWYAHRYWLGILRRCGRPV